MRTAIPVNADFRISLDPEKDGRRKYGSVYCEPGRFLPGFFCGKKQEGENTCHNKKEQA